MGTPKQVLKLWRDGNIQTGFALRQFFTDHTCGSSIPRKLKVWSIGAAVFVADQCPWFARKPLMNVLAGRKVYHDFLQTDHVIEQDKRGFPIVTCMKW